MVMKEKTKAAVRAKVKEKAQYMNSALRTIERNLESIVAQQQALQRYLKACDDLYSDTGIGLEFHVEDVVQDTGYVTLSEKATVQQPTMQLSVDRNKIFGKYDAELNWLLSPTYVTCDESPEVMTKEQDVLEMYKRIAFADITDFVTFGNEEVCRVKENGGVKFPSKIEALRTLSKYLSGFHVSDVEQAASVNNPLTGIETEGKRYRVHFGATDDVMTIGNVGLVEFDGSFVVFYEVKTNAVITRINLEHDSFHLMR